MPEHRIRLRGGWERFDLGTSLEASRRASLPIEWDKAGPVRLIRHFRSPPIDPSAESLRLELDEVPGLRSVRLNGEEFRGRPPEGGRWIILLSDPLPGRNTLALELDGEPGRLWGEIALIIAALR